MGKTISLSISFIIANYFFFSINSLFVKLLNGIFKYLTTLCPWFWLWTKSDLLHKRLLFLWRNFLVKVMYKNSMQNPWEEKKKKETVPVVQWQKIIPLQQTMEIRTQFLFTITLHSFSRITITLHIYKMAKEKQEWTLPENDWRKQKKALQKSWRTETYQKSVMKVLHLSYTARSNLFLLLQEIPIWFT